MHFEIEPMQAADWEAVATIYREGIETGNATFETAVPDWETWHHKHLPQCRLVAKSGEDVIGWAALTAVSSRQVYAGVAEVSVYVGASGQGKGIGKSLLQSLVKASENDGFWTLQASIFPENEISIHIHQLVGFRVVGRREKLAQRHGMWRDVLLMERRSRVVGV